MADYQLAQLNIAQMRYDTEAPEMADFVGNLDRINATSNEAATNVEARVVPAMIDDPVARREIGEAAAAFPYRFPREARTADRVEPGGCNICFNWKR